VEIQRHRLIRQTSGVKQPHRAAQSESSPNPVDTFEQGTVKGPELPDLSGLAKFSRSRSVAVKDTKLEDDSKRVVLLHNDNGAVQELDVNWSRTGRARDLEAITPSKGRGRYLAVEGSSFQEHKARLFELKLGAKGGEAERSYQLPEFGQEVEGLVALPQKDGTQKVLFGGRGDENGDSRVYWGTLGDNGLEFTPEGLKGQAVQSPRLGDGQRSIADLALDKEGSLWAVAAVDEGDFGPFKSSLYKLGSVSENPDAPVDNSLTQGYSVSGTKMEALLAQSDGSFLAGSDNESLGGRLEQFIV